MPRSRVPVGAQPGTQVRTLVGAGHRASATSRRCSAVHRRWPLPRRNPYAWKLGNRYCDPIRLPSPTDIQLIGDGATPGTCDQHVDALAGPDYSVLGKIPIDRPGLGSVNFDMFRDSCARVAQDVPILARVLDAPTDVRLNPCLAVT